MSKYIKCPVCDEELKDKESIYQHIEEEHVEILPPNWSGARFYFQQIHGRTTSNCIICGKETEWNDKTNKPYRFCTNPKCRDIYVQTFKKRMKQKYGKEHLLNDPHVQQKMLRGRSISGIYTFKDKGTVPYVGSYEEDFLQFLDVFLGFKSRDVIECPHYFEYYYEGEKKLYIPDFFIPSINTIIEIKDGGENPNTHDKIQEIDKVKEKAKDEIMMKQKEFNYIKITDKNYKPFLDFLINLKDNYDYTTMKFKRPLTFIGEHTNLLLEEFESYSSQSDFTGKEVEWETWGGVKYKGTVIEDDKSDTLQVKLSNGEIVACDRQVRFNNLNEGFIFNENDLYINFSEWKPEKYKNILYFTGLSGSGQSTLGRELASRHNAYLIELDGFQLAYDSSQIKFVDQYYKQNEYLQEFRKWKWNNNWKENKLDFETEFIKFFNWMTHEINTKYSDKLFIMEGMQVFRLLSDRVNSKPIVIKGTSMLKSMYQRIKRDADGKINWITEIKKTILWDIDREKGLQTFKKSLKEEVELLDEQKEISLSKEEMKEVKERFGEINCWIFKNKNDKYYVRTHRVRSKLYDSIQDIPKDVVQHILHK